MGYVTGFYGHSLAVAELATLRIAALKSIVFLANALALYTLLQVLRGIWWLLELFIIRPPFDPLRLLPGPDGKWLQNHFREVLDPEYTPDTHEDWVNEFGKTFRYHGFGSYDYRLISYDLRVITHVLNSGVYEKPWQTRRLLSRLVGDGVFAKEGEVHRIQRRIIAPAFTSKAVRCLSSAMYQKVEELRDKWESILRKEHKSLQALAISNEMPGDVSIDVAHWVSRATFDIIGLAGFDYEFRALEDESEEVCSAYRSMFRAADNGPGFKRIAELYFPIIEKLWPDDGIRTINSSIATIRRRGVELVKLKKQAILAEIEISKQIWDKDILSLLIKANLSENPAQRLSDTELLDQLSTLLFAGSDTTAISIAWSLYYLALYPELQTRLRNELATVSPKFHRSTSEGSSTGGDDMVSVLDALPFLDAIVRETLRLAPPAHGTMRVATRDDIIPLSEPIVLRTGETVYDIRIRKGSYVHIPIEGLNYSKHIWGEDSLDFNPDRWSSLPPNASRHSGPANVMSFSLGPHSCIGWRFSLLEMKVFLAVLIPHFTFSPDAEIRKYNAIITRPYRAGRLDEGPALPLKVSKLNAMSA